MSFYIGPQYVKNGLSILLPVLIGSSLCSVTRNLYFRDSQSFQFSIQKLALHAIPIKGTDLNGDTFVNADFDCLPGFRKSGDICVDIDECTDTIVKHNCDTATTKCSNLASTFKCVCIKPFVPKTDSKTECRPIASCYSDEYLDPTTSMVRR